MHETDQLTPRSGSVSDSPEPRVTQSPLMGSDIKDTCFGYRETILDIGSNIRLLFEHPAFSDKSDNHGEMKANIMLAYRHLEDARMRLGKVIQAYDGGTSCYPK